jgi:hypothetical protein
MTRALAEGGCFTSGSGDLEQQLAVMAEQLNAQGHLSDRMCGTTETRIVSANDGFDAVEHARREALTGDEMPGNLQDAGVHSQIVVASGDHEISANETLLANLVMMEETAARSFAGANSFHGVRSRESTDVCGEDFRIVQQLLHASMQYMISISRAW